MTHAKVDLGARLFFDPRMSVSGVYSCQSCHNIGMGGTDALETSIGHLPRGRELRRAGVLSLRLFAAPADEACPGGDVGRYQVTQAEEDQYVFRAAPVRNVALTAPYFHSGKVWSLAQDITPFLGTLTGEQPQIVHPTLAVRTDETPPPAPIDAPPTAN